MPTVIYIHIYIDLHESASELTSMEAQILSWIIMKCNSINFSCSLTYLHLALMAVNSLVLQEQTCLLCCLWKTILVLDVSSVSPTAKQWDLQANTVCSQKCISAVNMCGRLTQLTTRLFLLPIHHTWSILASLPGFALFREIVKDTLKKFGWIEVVSVFWLGALPQKMHTQHLRQSSRRSRDAFVQNSFTFAPVVVAQPEAPLGPFVLGVDGELAVP